MATDINGLIHQEAAHYGLPDWIAYPTVQAESGGDPTKTNAQSGAEGLLQLLPQYYGGPGINLYDPKTNLDKGFAVLGAEYQRVGKPSESLDNFIKVDASAGWPGKAPPGQDPVAWFKSLDSRTQFDYVRAFDNYEAHPQGSNPGVPGAPGAAGTAIHNVTGFSVNPVGWIQQGGWHLLIIVIALVLLVVTGAHIVSSVAENAPAPVVGAAGAVNELSKKVSREATKRTVGHVPVPKTRGERESGFRAMKKKHT